MGYVLHVSCSMTLKLEGIARLSYDLFWLGGICGKVYEAHWG